MPNTPFYILALDPMTKGFGYAVFEPPFRLVDRGFNQVRTDKYARSLVKLEKLFGRFHPSALVFEDTADPGSRRGERVRDLLDGFANLARERNVVVHRIARTAVSKCFSPDGRTTKHAIARRLTDHFPELAERLPPKRKIYESERERMAIFNALAFAVTFALA